MRTKVISFGLGLLIVSVIGFTTDQILNNVYDATNTALRTNVVAGTGGGPAGPTGPSGPTGPAGPSGPTGPGGVAGGSSPVTISRANASSTGTTVNRLAKFNTDGTVVITATTDTTGMIGIVTAGAGTTGSATIQLIGDASCDFDAATTAGDFVTNSVTTAGKCHDAGNTFPSSTAVIGQVASTNGGAGLYTVTLETPDIMNATNIKGGNPGKYPTPQPTATPQPAPTPEVNISYAGSLNVTGSTAISASATPTAGDRNIYCTSGSSTNATYTMPAATGTGRVIDVWKVDSGSKSCILAGAGSDKLNGAATLTLSAQYGHETCIDQASAVWLCTGNGT